MGIIANYTAYPADYIDAVIHDGDGENDTELAEYGLEKDSLLFHHGQFVQRSHYRQRAFGRGR